MIVESVVAATMVTGGAAAVMWPSRDRLLRRRLRATVVATMKTGAAFRGVLFEADSRSLVLRNAEVLGRPGDGVNIPVDGELVLARNDVEFLQRP